MPVAVIILLIVLIAIALRRITKMIIPIWIIMGIGAIITILCQQISTVNTLAAVEPDVMLYLFGAFLILQTAEESGYLEQLT